MSDQGFLMKRFGMQDFVSGFHAVDFYCSSAPRVAACSIIMKLGQHSIGRLGSLDALTPALEASGGVEKLGIHWSGQLGENQGMLYLDDAAVTNELLARSSLSDCRKGMNPGVEGWG